MIVERTMPDGRILRRSDRGMKIRQETGILYDEAVDSVPHSYIETDIPIDAGELSPEEELELLREEIENADTAVYRAALAEAITAKGVDTLPDSDFDTLAVNIGLIEAPTEET